MDAIVKIVNWEKHQRKDVKRPSWFAFDNRMVEDEKFDDFNGWEFKAWIYILSRASEKQTNEISVSFAPAFKRTSIPPEDFQSAIEKLEQLGIVTVEFPHTSRARHVDVTPQTDRQTLHNKTDITHNTQKTSGFIAAYCDRFFDRYGTNPHIDGKTAGIAKRLAKNMGEDRAIRLLDAFFQMPDAELVKSKHPLVKLELKLQEVVVFADSGAFTPRAQASDVDREQADKLKKETSRARRHARLLGTEEPQLLNAGGGE